MLLSGKTVGYAIVLVHEPGDSMRYQDRSRCLISLTLVYGKQIGDCEPSWMCDVYHVTCMTCINGSP